MKNRDIASLIEEFIHQLKSVRRLSENTCKSYQKDLNDFSEYLSDRKIDEILSIKERTIRLYLMHLNEKKLTKSSVARKLSALRSFFEFLMVGEIIQSNPVAKISNPKVKRKLPETINLDSFTKIFTLLKEEGDIEKEKLLTAIFELLYGSALRVSELCSLNIGDIDFERKNIRVMGKGSKERLVPLGTESSKSLKAYLDIRSNKNYSSPLFLTPSGKRIYREYIYKIVKKYLSKVSDITKTSPHILRHSAATHMLDRGADILAVKEILGHENLSTTQIYTHVSIERLKKSHKKAHPKS